MIVMKRSTVIVALVLAVLAGLIVGVLVASTADASALDRGAPAEALQCTPREQCCRVCNRGRACGDSCISRDRQCHVGRGCACDASEVCD